MGMLDITRLKHNRTDKKIQKFFLDDDFNDILESSHDIDRDLRLIGSGNYSKVFEFRDKYAIKIINPNTFNGIDCIPEIIILNNLSKKHDNIIKGKGVFKLDNSICLVMDRVTASLDRYKFTDNASKRSAISQLISAVNFLHKNRFLHLDLSLSNILYSIDENSGIKIYLSDFSLSKKTLNLTYNDGCDKISTIYRPYENLKGSKIYTNMSDLWSLGIIIHEINTDRRFESEITPIFVKGVHNVELSVIIHIQKLSAWNIWPYNTLLNLQGENRTYNGIEKLSINYDLLNYNVVFDDMIKIINTILDKDEYKEIDINRNNWYISLYCIVYCLYNSPEILLNFIFGNNLHSLMYLMKFFINIYIE